MANALMTGITAAAVNKYLRGPGMAYKDFVSMASRGTLLGETKGGSTFDWGLTFHDTEPDGAMGLIEGHHSISRCEPTLDINFLEHTTTNWLGFLPGANSDDKTPTAQVEYLGTGSAVQSGVVLTGAGDTDFDTLEIWYGGVTGVTQIATITTDYTVNTTTGEVTTIASTSGGNIADSDEVTARYVYDSTSSGDAFTVIKPGQIATADHWTNVALVCELTNPTYTNPYVIFIIKHPLVTPSAVTIPGAAMEEAVLPCKFTGYFDPSVGLGLDHAPVELQFGAA